MKAALTIMKKELKLYFYSPLAYVMGLLLLTLSGYFFYIQCIYQGYSQVHPFMGIFANTLLFAAPLMTMKLLAEEKKKGSIELLFSFPVKPSQIVFGKYLAVALVFTLILLITLIYTFILFVMGNPQVGITFSVYLGVFLQGLALLSLGLFISSLTDSQVVAGIGSLGLGLAFFLINMLGSSLYGAWADIVKEISFSAHLSSFFAGVIDLKDLAFFVLIIVLGLVLSTWRLDGEKWRK